MPPRILRRRCGLSVIAACALLSCVGCGEPVPSPPVAPTILATIYPTPTPLATATPTPEPTPDLATLREEADKAAFIGDYERAIALGQELLKFAKGTAIDVRLKLGQWQLAAGDAQAAIAVLQSLTAEPDSSRSELADAHILLGRAYATIGDSHSAGARYAAALAAGAVISPWLHLWLGDIALNTGRLADAVEHYQRSLDSVPTVAQEFARREKLALAHQLAGNYSAAVEQYETILARAQLPAYRARITWELAQVLQASGQVGRAYQLMRTLVESAPKTPQALQAAQALLNAGQAVDDLQYGIVAYHNGSYVVAREAFRRAIERDPGRANDVRYWAALNYIKLGSVSDALRNLDQTIAANAASAPATIQALGEKAKILANAGNTAQAQATFSQFVARATASPLSGRTMLEVGQVFARYPALWAEAAQAYVAAADLQTVDQSLAAEALIRAVAMYYRLGRHSDALSLAQRLRSAFNRLPQALLGRLWEGKLRLILGDEAGGAQVLRDLASEAPDTFEGARAAELLVNPEQPPLSASVRAALGQTDEASEQAEAERWLRGWLGLDERTDLRTLRADLVTDPRFSRGSALWQLGFKAEAREEFDGLRLAFGRDAMAQYQLALFFRQIGLYRASISAADALMRLSPAKGPSDLPAFIGKLLYPTYYAELVMKHAEEFGLDPLLLFALIRQESLFEPFALSSAAANGLMQVIPSTGREIHAELGWPANYTTADLQKPFVSVRFGSYYLAKQRRLFNGDLYAALAAYNGGPANALRWRERSAGDPDLFYMFITFDETQHYIRALAANYAIYQRLYGRP